MTKLNYEIDDTDHYKKLLKQICGLSRLFSNNDKPYINYRVAESLYCKAFTAEDMSRSDISFDAKKDVEGCSYGVGIKTFTISSNKKYQKIAEFNEKHDEYSHLDNEELVKEISGLRNKRLNRDKKGFDIDKYFYHCLAREKGAVLIHEEEMSLININKINNIDTPTKDHIIYFEDDKNKYKFNKSKSTLYKQFVIDEPEKFEVKILDNPFEVIESINIEDYISKSREYEDIILLPLYSMASGKVEEKSGLNQWNAGGRERRINEVYIPVPSWLHKKFPDFFPSTSNPFDLVLPNKKVLNAKMCQGYSLEIDGENIRKGKGLMSNPNVDLGKWILRDVLDIEEGNLVTREMLEEIGIDSVEIRKVNDEKYEMDFKKVGSFEEFVEEVE